MSNIVKVVDGWQVEDRDGQATVLDTGLAEHAEMGQPRDIRKVIGKAIAEGALKHGARGERAENEACFWAETEIIPGFGGTSQEITVYRLNRAAALFIVTRLRTPKAVELTLAIVKVFDQVTSGRALAPALPQDVSTALASMSALAESLRPLLASLPMLIATNAAAIKMMEEVSSGATNAAAGRAFALTVRSKVSRYARAQCNGTKRDLRSWVSKGHNLLRTAMRYPAGPGRGWPAFPSSQRQDALLLLEEMASTAESAKAGRSQLTLVSQPPADPKSGTTTGTGGE